MSRRFVSTFVAAGAAALLATAAGAQMNSGTGSERIGSRISRDLGTSAGSFDTVVSVDQAANRIVVENATGQQRMIHFDGGTGIERRGMPGSTATTMRIAQLSPGDRIIVSGSSQADGFTAQRIEVLPSGGMGPPGVMTPNANPASPPGTTRPGDPNAEPGANPASPQGGGNR